MCITIIATLNSVAALSSAPILAGGDTGATVDAALEFPALIVGKRATRNMTETLRIQ
jgi:hypothetical protein